MPAAAASTIAGDTALPHLWRVGAKALLRFAKQALQAVGADEWTVQIVADALVTASLRGTDSHGIRLLSGYCQAGKSGFMNPTPQYSITKPYPAFAVLDADRGFGLAAGCRAIDVGIELAKTSVPPMQPFAATCVQSDPAGFQTQVLLDLYCGLDAGTVSQRCA